MRRWRNIAALFPISAVGIATALSAVQAASTPTCLGKAATIVGTEGPDFINAGDDPDVIVGLGGKDDIRGNKGDDFVCGGAGDDVIGLRADAGSDGDDHHSGGPGNDELFDDAEDEAHDVLLGGPGIDEVAYTDVIADLSAGTATAPGFSGQDSLDGIENIYADSDFRAGSILIGDAGPNALTSNEGRDTLRGRGGDDYLSGAENRDRLNGGPGFDTCNVDPLNDIAKNCER